jgi:hypothetical protein
VDILNKYSILIIVIVVIFGIMVIPQSSQAQGFGLGIIIGDPTGLSAKYHFGEGGVDLAVAWNINNDMMALHSNYHFHIPMGVESLTFFVGVGVYIVLWNEFGVAGIRVPLGLEYILSEIPLGLFFEVAPGLDLIPGTDFSLGAGIGVRWYFG